MKILHGLLSEVGEIQDNLDLLDKIRKEFGSMKVIHQTKDQFSSFLASNPELVTRGETTIYTCQFLRIKSLLRLRDE